MASRHQGRIDRRPAGRRSEDGRCAGRAARFLTRVDDHLPALADDAARRAFIDGQLEGWERRYARFIATEGASEPIGERDEPPQAADFLLTLTGLAARREALRRGRTGGEHGGSASPAGQS